MPALPQFVAEVIDVARSFPGTQRAESNLISRGTEIATDVWWKRVQAQYDPEESTDVVAHLAWADFLELRRARYFGATPPGMNAVERFELLRSIEESVPTIAPSRLLGAAPHERELLADLATMLFTDVASSRAIRGASDDFFERVLAALSIGVIPVGWRGRFPDGELLVVKVARASQT